MKWNRFICGRKPVLLQDKYIKKWIVTLFLTVVFIISLYIRMWLYFKFLDSAYKTTQCDTVMRLLSPAAPNSGNLQWPLRAFFSLLLGSYWPTCPLGNTHEWLWAGFNLSCSAVPGEGCRWLRPQRSQCQQHSAS